MAAVHNKRRTPLKQKLDTARKLIWPRKRPPTRDVYLYQLEEEEGTEPVRARAYTSTLRGHQWRVSEWVLVIRRTGRRLLRLYAWRMTRAA